jgi:hypothetical protein
VCCPSKRHSYGPWTSHDASARISHSAGGQKIHIPPNFVVESCGHSLKASRGEPWQVEEPVWGREFPSFDFDPTVAGVLGATLGGAQVGQVRQSCATRLLAPFGVRECLHHTPLAVDGGVGLVSQGTRHRHLRVCEEGSCWDAARSTTPYDHVGQDSEHRIARVPWIRQRGIPPGRTRMSGEGRVRPPPRLQVSLCAS